MEPQIATALIAAASALAAGGLTYLGARVKARADLAAARASKAPDVQEQINSAVSVLVSHYTTALEALQAEVKHLRGIITEQTATLAEQTATIGDLESHVDTLTTAMTDAGVAVPPRKRKAA